MDKLKPSNILYQTHTRSYGSLTAWVRGWMWRPMTLNSASPMVTRLPDQAPGQVGEGGWVACTQQGSAVTFLGLVAEGRAVALFLTPLTALV